VEWKVAWGIEILWLEKEKFENYFKLLSQYSSRQTVEKHETCTCVAVEIEIEIKIRIAGEKKSRVRPIQQVQTFTDDGGKKENKSQ